jgi:hypothetical protein
MVLAPAGDALYVADRYKIRRVELTPTLGAVTTVAGGSAEGWANAVGTAAQFRGLGALALEGTTLWIADLGNHEIRTLDLSTLAVTTAYGDHQQPEASDVPPRFIEPRALALTTGRVLVGESATHVLRAVDRLATPSAAATLAGTRSQAGNTDGPLLAARLDRPRALALRGQSVYFGSGATSSTGQRLRRLDLASSMVSTLAQAPDPLLVGLYAPVVAPDGRLFAVCEGPDLFQVDPDTGASIGLTAGGPLLLPQAGAPSGGVVLGNDLYLVDPDKSLLYRVRLDTGDFAVLAGRRETLAAADGPLDEAIFVSPTAIATCNGDLYVVESDYEKAVAGQVVRWIDLTNRWVTTIAGSLDIAGDRDGIGVAARFDSPEGIACDGQSLYVADTRNHTIRQIVLATGGVTTLVGVSGEAGALDGVGAAARLNYPRGLVFDPATGDLLVADRDDNVIRRIR